MSRQTRDMLETSARLLRLLALLQARPDWTGPQLAERLGVTTRTVRNDVERLRALGYPVHAVARRRRAATGSARARRCRRCCSTTTRRSRSRSGCARPPPARSPASRRPRCGRWPSSSRCCPSRLRRRVGALHEATVVAARRRARRRPRGAERDRRRVRDHERLRFDYRRHDGGRPARPSSRTGWSTRARRWYLVAWDVDRDDWRTFRVDRMRPRAHRPRFRRRDDPDGRPRRLRRAALGQATWAYRARVEGARAGRGGGGEVPPAVAVEAIDERTCFATVGADTPRMLAFWLAMIDADFDAADHPELAAELRALAERYLRARQAA